jgi:hypothetical protein
MCPFKYYLEYVLGLRKGDSFATLNGRIIHSVLERYSLGHIKHWRTELMVSYKKHNPWRLHKNWKTHTVGCPGCQLIDGFQHYHGSTDDLIGTFDKSCPAFAYEEAVRMVESVLNRPTNPFDFKLIDVEHRFKLPIGEGISISGIIDMVSEVEPGILEIRDWKTGNFLPTYEELEKDPQLRLYDLAASILFPDYDVRLLTFDYLKHKRYTFVISDEEREKNRLWLIKTAKQIEADFNPKRLSKTPHKFWKCKALCSPEDCMTHWPARKSVLQVLKDEMKNGKKRKRVRKPTQPQ